MRIFRNGKEQNELRREREKMILQMSERTLVPENGIHAGHTENGVHAEMIGAIFRASCSPVVDATQTMEQCENN